MARPRLGENKKTHRIGVFFTEKEYAEICKKAESVGFEPSDFLRRIGLGREIKGVAIVPEINKQTAQDLNGGLNLLNQAIRLVHQGKAENISTDLLEYIRDEIRTVRELLLGR